MAIKQATKPRRNKLVMILRSLTKHVKDQNWFAVVLDFGIVVVGVFIGIQVANWNDQQVERARTERKFSELIIGLREVREEAANQSGDFLERATIIDALLDAFEAGDEPKSDELAEALGQVLFADVPPSLPAGVNELLVAGRLDLLGDAPVRDALIGLSAHSNRIAIASNQLFDRFRTASASVRQYVSFSRKPDFDYRKESFAAIIAVDIEALRSDPKAQLALTQLFFFHSNMRAFSQVTEELVATALAAAQDAGY
jgi:hypothetical protein